MLKLVFVSVVCGDSWSSRKFFTLCPKIALKFLYYIFSTIWTLKFKKIINQLHQVKSSFMLNHFFNGLSHLKDT
jgi:hypothetical protein